MAAVAACLVPVAAVAAPGLVDVSGPLLLRDGQPWSPHGFYQIAFEVPPGVPNTKTFWTVASGNFTPAEYVEMRLAGADSVRIQVAQTGMDPQNGYSTPAFRVKAIAAIAAARLAGLTVIVSVQDEAQTGEKDPAPLPNDATRRVWQEIAPVFGRDKGVMFELLNEPSLPPTPTNWQAWAAAMNETIATVRATGAANVVVADGLGLAEVLDGAPQLSDPLGQVAYADHPYAHQQSDQTAAHWDATFGAFARNNPVMITEWGIGYYCDASTPAATKSFFQYLQSHNIGIEAGTWDWQSAGFGSAVYDFPQSRLSHFIGPEGTLGCHPDPETGVAYHDTGEGDGAMIETWFRTGTPPASVE